MNYFKFKEAMEQAKAAERDMLACVNSSDNVYLGASSEVRAILARYAAYVASILGSNQKEDSEGATEACVIAFSIVARYAYIKGYEQGRKKMTDELAFLRTKEKEGKDVD